MNDSIDAVILLVDDQPDNTDAMMGYLNESGFNYKFLQAINGKIACKVAETRLPDLIIMDWEMPVMNGHEALVSLKNNPVTADIPVVMATGRASGGDLQQALDSGAADYIRKPIEKLELLARVKTCLDLSRYIKEIKAKNEELKTYDRMVSHDLKGPIGNIVTLANFLKEDEHSNLSDECQVYLNQIINSSRSSQELIDGILSFASADEPADLEEEVDLKKIVEDAVSGHSMTIKAKNASVHVEDLPKLKKGISVKIYQLFYNLIGNALKFQLPENNPVITIGVQGDSEIYVKDNGVGFDQSNASEIFKPLKRLNNHHKYDGHGIGLGTCKRIADFHGWDIRAESEVGKGSKFIIKT